MARSGINKKSLPFLAAGIGNIFWGLSYLFTRTALKVSSPEILLSLRFITAFLLLNILMVCTGKRLNLKGRPLLLLGILAVAEPACFYLESYGLLYTNATFCGIALAVVPVVALGFAAIFLREYPTKRQIVYSLVCIAGVILITLSGSEIGVVQPVGLLFLGGALLGYASYRTINRSASKNYSSWDRTYVILFSCMVVFTVAALFQVRGDLHAFVQPLHDLHFLLPMLTLSVFCSIVSNLLVNYAAQELTVVELSVVGTVSTVCSMFGGVVFLREPMTGLMLFGALMILFGIRQVTKRREA